MKNAKLDYNLFKKYSLSTFYPAECWENRGIRSFWSAGAHREYKYKVSATKGWVRVADGMNGDFNGHCSQGRFVERVGVEVGCEGFGSVERKERSYRQEIEVSVASSEAEEGEWARQTEWTFIC